MLNIENIEVSFLRYVHTYGIIFYGTTIKYFSFFFIDSQYILMTLLLNLIDSHHTFIQKIKVVRKH